jgi:uncharacterized protein involved in type VI secretion and phage assembly
MTQELDLLGLLEGRVNSFEDQLEGSRQRIAGVVLAEVTDIDDPQRLGRVKVRFAWLSQQVESAWAQVATAWAGSNRGSYLLPEVGDEAVVAFRHGSLQHPYILGFLWSETAQPPEATPLNDRRELRSRSGHRVVFSDAAGSESLTLRSKGGHTIVLDDSAAKTEISIKDSGGHVSIVLDSSSGKVSVTSTTGQIAINAGSGSISLDAANIAVHATGVLQLKGDGSVVVSGGTVALN